MPGAAAAGKGRTPGTPTPGPPGFPARVLPASLPAAPRSQPQDAPDQPEDAEHHPTPSVSADASVARTAAHPGNRAGWRVQVGHGLCQKATAPDRCNVLETGRQAAGLRAMPQPTPFGTLEAYLLYLPCA
jgi:hypothetical protein